MDTCGQCGAWAPEAADRCAACEATPLKRLRGSHTEPRCVQIRLTFPCGACNLPAPLERVADDGVVVCCRCGLRQAIDPGHLAEMLRTAWGVADLWHPDPEGGRPSPVSIAAINPYRDPTTAGRRFQGPGGLEAWLGRGIPLDDAEGRPVELTVESPGRVLTSTGARYELSSEALGLCEGLVGVVADEHRLDDSTLDLAVAGEGQAFSCARCGAALPVDGTRRLVACSYCEAVHHIPSDLRHRLREDPVPDAWWLLFEGDSPLRRQLASDPPEVLAVEPIEDAELGPLRTAFDKALVLGLPTVALLLAGALTGGWWLLWHRLL
jgi:hypothetical protein